MAGARHIRKIDESAGQTPIALILQPFERFARMGASGGILLLLCAVAGMIWANSAWAEGYEHFWHTTVTVGFGDAALTKSLLHWINDGLMVIFFFLVGLEIKREILVGELATIRRAAVPMLAAVGGMMVPAGVFAILNHGTPELRGWGVPMATDIAFALGVLALVGNRVPPALRVFIASLAIVDDIGALLVIAIFYTEELHTDYLIAAGAILLLMGMLNLGGERKTLPFAVLGVVLWILVLKSGIHATIAGVLAAITIPVRARVNTTHFLGYTRARLDEFEKVDVPGESILTNPEQQGIMDAVEHASIQVQTPLQRLEHRLVPWSAFVIVPIFAIANAGVPVSAESLASAATSRQSIGIVLGLVVGKPVGVVLLTWLAVKAGFGELPEGVRWRHVIGAGCLAGIGFTMALFIASLAYADAEHLNMAKMAVLGASLASGVIGLVVLATGKRA